MSYDVHFEDAEGSRIALLEPLDIRGGTYCVGGSSEAWLNITYNYAGYFFSLFGPEGLRGMYGMEAGRMIPIIEVALWQLKNDPPPILDVECSCAYHPCHDRRACYWATTADNVHSALANLLELAKAVPVDAIFRGD